MRPGVRSAALIRVIPVAVIKQVTEIFQVCSFYGSSLRISESFS